MNGEMHEIAEAAAKKAVHETFRLFGVDTDNQQSVNEFRADLVFTRRQRRLAETIVGRCTLVIVGAVTVGVLSFTWDAIKAKLGW